MSRRSRGWGRGRRGFLPGGAGAAVDAGGGLPFGEDFRIAAEAVGDGGVVPEFIAWDSG